MKTKLIALVLMAGSSLFAQAHFYVGARIGHPAPASIAVYGPPPAPLTAYLAPAPRPGYTWVAGYWYPAGARYSWHAGYWTRPAFASAYWVGPRYATGRYYRGYWRR